MSMPLFLSAANFRTKKNGIAASLMAASSFGGKAGRHQHAISFMSNSKTDDAVAYFLNLYAGNRYGLYPDESYINRERPRLKRMLSRWVESGFETSTVGRQ